jgi:murein tripeptide amidase MpaA
MKLAFSAWMGLSLACSMVATAQTQSSASPASVVEVSPHQPFAGQMVVKAHVRTPAQLLAVSQIAENIWTCNPGVGDIDVQVTHAQRQAIEQLGVVCDVWIPDLQAEVDREQAEIMQAGANAVTDWFATYKPLAEIEARLASYAAQSPAIVTAFTVGKSFENRDMRGIRITGPDLPGNPRSGRPQVMFEAGQHAREWAGPMAMMYFADTLVHGYDTDARIRDVLDHAEIIIVPVVNVDGYFYTWQSTANRFWRKNRRTNSGGSFGVDLNRNWGFQWGGEGSSGTQNNDTYRGTAPFSEPETQRLRDFISSQPRLRAHIDYHTYTQLILSPWGYTSDLPPAATTFNTLNTLLKQGTESVYGVPYLAGPTYTTIYPASGVAQDWVYGARNVLAFGVELRDKGRYGFALPSSMILPTARENFEGALRLVEWTYQTLNFTFPNGIPEFIDANASTTIDVKVASGSLAYAGSTPTLFWRTASSPSFSSLSMTSNGTGWSATIPAIGCRNALEYYIQATTTTAQQVRFPLDAPSRVLIAQAASTTTAFFDDAEVDTGWSLSTAGDTTLGRWERAVPSAVAIASTSTDPALPTQIGTDHTPVGTRCWVTGASASTGPNGNDVDAGRTTLTSPEINCTVPRGTILYKARASYWFWYFNNQTAPPADDSMLVQVSNDGGATWVSVDEVSDATSAWTLREIDLDAFLPITDRMRIRFIARDGGPDSVSEAQIDDVVIRLITCPRTADFDDSGGTPDAGDVDAFFIAWLAGDPSADFDGSGGTPDAADIDEFFYLWLLGI